MFYTVYIEDSFWRGKKAKTRQNGERVQFSAGNFLKIQLDIEIYNYGIYSVICRLSTTF